MEAIGLLLLLALWIVVLGIILAVAFLLSTWIFPIPYAIYLGYQTSESGSPILGAIIMVLGVVAAMYWDSFIYSGSGKRYAGLVLPLTLFHFVLILWFTTTR